MPKPLSFGFLFKLPDTMKNDNPFTDLMFTLELKISRNSGRLDGLTPSYSWEKSKIEQYIQEAKNNHSYTRSKYQIEQEKFQERIEVYPKD